MTEWPSSNPAICWEETLDRKMPFKKVSYCAMETHQKAVTVNQPEQKIIDAKVTQKPKNV